ncbi:23S rRNA (guanosine(2251)-2'-O)-methyltransferase RlmB [Cohnella luojiensis]|uniref:23S rRNA (Guanosine(2251)-2'-O)-methyltransferase RlmB n=1 Tax=Cohnella luojiensis TaxID=652876 RepID=A0A4Y8LR17_9BACL|nr:23S rRNA (guanosine(2251)-2'-O)-methyltransferase RlmB [Cohnella luojiensis]TFE23855.1 23S rRNA (guanosine(2251)-2'-O)-methyltransferase RlmB [Cohnella luojiensis]
MSNYNPRSQGNRPAAGSKPRSSDDHKTKRYQPAASPKETAVENEQWAEESTLKSEEEYLAGKHPILEALKAGRAINKIFMSNQAQRHLVQPIMEEAKARGIVVQQVDKSKLDRLVPDLQHQGVVAQAAAVAYAEVDELLARAAQRGEAPLIVLLDEVEDPHNLGSVLRTADCTGVHGVIVPKRRSAGLTAVVAKTSAGAVEYVPVARVSNLVQTMEKLKEGGLWIAGADAGAKEGFYETNLTGPLAIVIGNEGQGLSRLVRERCDFILSLPMVGQINSLNASVAAGVILYEVVRQRQQALKKTGATQGQASSASDHA